MSAFVLDEAGLALIRWACRARLQYGITSVDGPESHATALRAISSPDASALLASDLLSRAGVKFHRVFVVPPETRDLSPGAPPGFRYIVQHGNKLAVRVDGSERLDRDIAMSDVPRLVLALADLATGDRDGAVKALREAGR